MKNLIFLFLSLFILACNSTSKEELFSKKIIVTGKIENFNPEELEVTLAINRPGLANQEPYYTSLDTSGNFYFSFESYAPTDAWIVYKTNFLVLLHPGDSIYVVFDGKTGRRPKLLETIQFSGDAAEINNEASIFQRLYFANPLYTDNNRKRNATKAYNLEDFIQYMDSVKMEQKDLLENFVEKVNPSRETYIWAKTYLDNDYYRDFGNYPGAHKYSNKLTEEEWDVPINYYDALLDFLPITDSMLISGYSVSGFVNNLHYSYINKHARKIISENDELKLTPSILDSLIVELTITKLKDPLARQLVLTEFFSQKIDRDNIEAYEKYEDVIDKHIIASFLKESLYAEYVNKKEQKENPAAFSQKIFQEASKSLAGNAIDSILNLGKNKVTYIDFWATWCGPCLAEMPNSKKLKEELEGKEVEFVYICIDDDEKKWKDMLEKLELEGHHFYMDKKQSNDLRRIFEIYGIPYYILIDRNGVIVQQGSQWRPDYVKSLINELLE